MKTALIFYSVFSLVYGLMNWLVFRQAAWALNLTGWFRTFTWIWFLIMTLSPAVTGIIGQRADFWSWITFIWLGFIFYLFLGAILLLVLRPAAGPLGWEQVPKYGYIALMIVAAAACAWGTFHTRYPVVKEVKLPVEKMAPGLSELRIAVISDVHLFSVEGEGRLKRIIGRLEPLKYDLLLSLGDMIEPAIEYRPWEPVAALFDRLTPQYGKYAINGNHESYANIAAKKDVSRRFHEACGFTLLVDQSVRVGDALWLVGVNDHGHDTVSQDRELQLLREAGDGLPVLLLKHQPAVNEASIGHYDLMLSGHTHNGQLWPFNYMVKAVFQYIHGLYDLSPRSRLYVTPGTGTWGPPMRIGTTPEITIIHLVKESAMKE